MGRHRITLAAAMPLLLLSWVVIAAEWQELNPPNAPSARSGHTMATVGGTAYLYGGWDASLMPQADLWRWDRAAGDWLQEAASAPPGARHSHNAVTVGDHLFIGNGYGAGGVRDDFWLFDPATGQWQQLSFIPAPPGRALAMMAAVDDDAVFVGRGYDEDGDVLTDAWILYLPTADKGSAPKSMPLADLPVPIYGAAAAALGGRPAVIGGWLHSKQPVDDIYVYDFDSSSWQQVIPGGSAVLGRTLPAVAHWRSQLKTWGDTVFILGGESAEKADASANTQIYNLVSNSWSYGPDMLLPLSSQAAAALSPSGGSGPVEVLMFGGVRLDRTPIDWTFLFTTDLTVSREATLYIPASAHATGVNAFWVNDLELHNRGFDHASGTLALLLRDQANPSPTTMAVAVPAGQSVRLADVLSQLGVTSGTAALRLEVEGGELMITSRTFNQGPAGTYGQFIPAVDLDHATAFGDEVRLIQLSRCADPATGFRTNIGFVNLTGSTITVDVGLFTADGTSVGTVTVDLQGFEYGQMTDIFNLVGAGDVADGFAVVRTTTAEGRFLAYASVVDNQTGDPIYIPGV